MSATTRIHRHSALTAGFQAEAHECSDACGKIGGVLSWYLDEYTFARENIFLGRRNGDCIVTIDNQLLNEGRGEGLFLQLERLVQMDNGNPQLVQTFSTARCYRASADLVAMLPDDSWPDEGKRAIGQYQVPELFSFKRNEIKNFISINATLVLVAILLYVAAFRLTNPQKNRSLMSAGRSS